MGYQVAITDTSTGETRVHRETDSYDTVEDFEWTENSYKSDQRRHELFLAIGGEDIALAHQTPAGGRRFHCAEAVSDDGTVHRIDGKLKPRR